MTVPVASGFRAFLSYSHADEHLAARMHRRLEAYRPPRGLGIDGRLRPVFRDRDELASSGSLTAAIQDALDASAALIVVCSPAAARSRWVAEEIRYFRSRHPERPVLAIVASGDPAADPVAEPNRAAFPLALLLRDVMQPDAARVDPLAADARPEGDGFNLAFLRLAAGLLGVPFDQLRQRQARLRQRNLALIAAASMGLSAVFAGLAWRATVAGNEARAARAQAELELTAERETRGFLLSVFELADPSEARGRTVTVREVLDRAVARIDATDFSRPAVRARFQATMGQAYARLGLNRRGAELLRQSLATLPASPEETVDVAQAIDSTIELADVLFDMGDYPAALSALELLDAPLGTSATPLQAARADNVRGDVLSYLDEDEAAERAYRKALNRFTNDVQAGEAAAAGRARSLGGLALLRHFAGDHAESQQLYAQTLDILLPLFGENHPDALWARISWGSAAYANGDTKAARLAWEASLAVAVDLLGEGNPEVATIKNNLGRLLLESGDYAAAEPLLRAALEIDRRHRVERFDDLAFTLHNLALVRTAAGDEAEARLLLEEALDLATVSGHRMLGSIHIALADLACTQGDTTAGRLNAAAGVAETDRDYPLPDWRQDQARLVAAYCEHQAGAKTNLVTLAESICRLVGRWPDGGYFGAQAVRLGRTVLGNAPYCEPTS